VRRSSRDNAAWTAIGENPVHEGGHDDLPYILYVAARLPELSETFVYREMEGLRARGRLAIAASVRAPARFDADPVLRAMARNVFVIYAPATLAALPVALLRHPAIAMRGLLDAAGADHRSIKSRLKHAMQAMMGITAGWRLRHRGIGHVHAHMAHVPTTVGLYIARTLGARFSFTGHAADLFVDRAALAFKLNQADFVACISHWHRDFYANVAPLDCGRMPVVRCSVAIPQTIAVERAEVVTVARLVAKKGLDLLICSFARAAPVGWTLRILGDGPERTRLTALVEELGMADRIQLEGAQPHAICLAAIATAGLFVLACRTAASGDRDGIPVVLMEAMAAGKAVIAGDLPAIRELIEDGVSGMLVAPDTVEELAAAITALVIEPERRIAFGQAARERITTEFSDAVNLNRLERAFDGATTA